MRVPAPLLQTSMEMVEIEMGQMDLGHMKMNWDRAVQGAEMNTNKF